MEQKHNLSLRNLLILLFLVFFISLIPLYYIGTYAHPNADDYSYGISSKHVWENSHSFVQVLESASEKTVNKYNTWQGNFSAIFLMYLQPGIFGEDYYFITPFLLLTSFLISSFFFFYALFRKIMKAPSSLSLLTSLIIIFFSLQFVKVPSDSFYWYNGGIYYTFFYSLSLLLYGLLIHLQHCKHNYSKRLLLIPSILLSFIIGGGNYATALLNAILLCFLVLYFLYRKNRLILYYLPVFLVGLIALFISISGPGNALRQSTIGPPHNPILSILLSFVYGGYSIANVTEISIFLFWLLLIPIFWKMIDYSTFSFKYPLCLLFLSFCIYSAQITPVIYAQGIRIPYRIRNIVCFNYYIFIAINQYYFLGYLKQKKELPHLTKPLSLRFYYGFLLLAIIISCVGRITVTENEYGNVKFSNLTFTASSIYSLVTKEAQAYDLEHKERISKLETMDNKDIVLSSFIHKPYVLFHSDISNDPSFWKNRHLAKYYKKKTVRLN